MRRMPTWHIKQATAFLHKLDEVFYVQLKKGKPAEKQHGRGTQPSQRPAMATMLPESLSAIDEEEYSP